MPIYEYECSKCGKMTEAIQRFSDLPLTQCSNCDGELHRLISMSTFHLKGSGWYVTDYAGKNQNTSCAKSTEGTKTEGGESKTQSSASSTE